MKIRYSALLFAFALAAHPANFEREEIVGLRLSLVDDKKVEVYRLGKNGVALAQIGEKGGPIAPPAFHWKVEDGRLVLTDGNALKESFELIARSEKSMKLRRRSGEEVVFEITQLK